MLGHNFFCQTNFEIVAMFEIPTSSSFLCILRLRYEPENNVTVLSGDLDRPWQNEIANFGAQLSARQRKQSLNRDYAASSPQLCNSFALWCHRSPKGNLHPISTRSNKKDAVIKFPRKQRKRPTTKRLRSYHAGQNIRDCLNCPQSQSSQTPSRCRECEGGTFTPPKVCLAFVSAEVVVAKQCHILGFATVNSARTIHVHWCKRNLEAL